MKYSVLRFSKIIITCAAALCAAPIFGDEKKLSLDGEWDFSCIDSVGTSVQSGKIKVPGVWDAQGYGGATDKLKHNFVGVGRYIRNFTLPQEWFAESGAQTYIVLEGVSRYAKVWINGKYAGEALGLVGSHKIDATPFLEKGENVVRIDVDSRQDTSFDAISGASQFTNGLGICWGGLFGHVYLKRLPAVRLENVYIRTRIDPAKIIAETQIGVHGSAAQYPLAKDSDPKARQYALNLEVFGADGKRVAQATRKDAWRPAARAISAEIPDAKLWSPDAPNLYKIKLTLSDADGKVLHTFNWRVGIKELEIKLGWGANYVTRTQVCLNGSPIYLRGYGDDHIYLKEFAMPSDKRMYIDRLKKIKALGFNHVRNHSTIMPPEYFEACDEVGMLPNAEFAISCPQQTPGTNNWRKFSLADSRAKTYLDFYLERFEQAVRDCRNYTCIFAWVGGNEFYMGEDPFDRKNPLPRDFMNIVRRLDPDRFFIDTDGEFEGYILDSANDRDSLDMYVVLFDEWADLSSIVGKKYDMSKSISGKHVFDKFTRNSAVKDPVPLKPVISHETGNFTAFTRPDTMRQFDNSNFKPFWMSDSVAKLEKLGLLKEADNWALATEKLCLRLHKHNIEAHRRRQHIIGYHIWLIQDYRSSSNGFFDFGFRQKPGFKTEEILKFNSPVVLLQKGINFAYASGEKISGDFIVSNYGGKNFSAEFSGFVASNGKRVAEIPAGKISIPNGKVRKCADFSAAFDVQGDAPQQFDVVVNARADDGRNITNDWSFWVFPAKIPAPQGRLVADTVAFAKLPSSWNVRKLRIGAQYAAKEGEIFFASTLDDSAMQSLKNGAKVVLLNPSNFAPLTMKYKSQWWRAGGSEHSNYVGGYVEKSSPLSPLAPELYCAEALAPLLENSARYDIDALPQKPENTLRALSSITLYKEYSSVFRAKVLNGELIVSGLSHAACRDLPVNAWVLKVLATAPISKTIPPQTLLSLKK